MENHMKAAIFIEPGRIILGEKPIPDIGPLDAEFSSTADLKGISLAQTAEALIELATQNSQVN